MRLKSRRALSPAGPPTLLALLSLIAIAALLIGCSGSAPAAAPTAQPAPATTPQTSAPTPAQAPPTAAPAPTTAPAPTQPPPITAPVPTAAPAAQPAPTQAPPTAAPAAAPAATTAPAPTQAPPAAASTGGAVVFTLGEGTIARYKVEEVLARTGSWTATSETAEVAGQLAFDADGALIPDESGVIVQAATLVTDSDRRDRYVRERTLNASQYPEIVFRPTAIDGLPTPLTEAQGSIDFSISGDLTIRDQTRPTTWSASADFGAATISGVASVEFTFADFGMDKPSVPIVLSVEDTIRLEIDFMGSLSQRSADAALPSDADADAVAFVNTLGDENAPVTIIEFSDFQ